LFSAAGYAGRFARLEPAIPALQLGWNTNGLTNGVISIVAQPTPAPFIASVSATDTQFAFVITNGVPNWPCQIRSTTNLALPLNQWTLVVARPFDLNGRLTVTNVVNPNRPAQFFVVELE
jgi:hypothetical protein